MNFFVFVIFSFSPLSVCLSLSHPCLSTYLLLPLLSLFLSFSLPSLSSPSYSHSCLPFYLSLTPVSPPSLWLPLSSTPVSLSIFLSPTMPLFFCGSLSLPLLSLSLSRSCLSFSLPLLSLFSSFSLSPIPVSLFLPSLSLYLSRIPVSLPISISLSFSLPLLSLFSSFSLSPTPVFLLIFLSHTLSLFLSFLSFSLSSLSLSSFSHSYLSLVISLSLFLSLSPIPVSLSLSPIPISLSPTPVSLSIFFPIPVVFLSFSHSRLPFYLCLIPVSPSPSLWFSFFHPYLSSYLSLSHRCLIFSYRSLSLSHASLSLLANMSQSCRMVSTVLYFYYITLIIYILYYLDFKILSFVRDSSYDMYYKGCGLLCAHKKSFNTAIPLPVRSLGPYMYVHYSLSLGRKRT